MTFQKDLKAIAKELQKLAKQIERLQVQITKMEKQKTKPPTAKAPGKKKAVKQTATGKVLSIMNRSRKGVSVSTLMQKTGFINQKIWNIIYKASKEGKVKRVGKGIYVGAK